jgi:hypothetical protein
MLGPAVAGLIMATLGTAYVFLFDAISYIGVIFVVKQLQLRPKESAAARDKTAVSAAASATNVTSVASAVNFGAASPTGKAISATPERLREGIYYFFRRPATRYKVIQYIFSIIIVVPMVNLVFRSYLKEKFTLTPEEFGYLFSFPAMGAMLGAIYLMLAALKQPIKNLIFAVPLLVVSLLALLQANTPMSAAVVLAVGGFFSYLNIASLTQSVQLETPDEYRGRLGALFTLGFNTIAPLMSFPIGYYTDTFGFDRAIRDLTWIFAILSVLLAISNFKKTA